MTALDRFFRLFERRKNELDPDYEFIERGVVDLEIISDRIWSKLDDELCVALMAAFAEVGSPQGFQLESRLSTAECEEAFHGYVFVYLTAARVIGAKAGGAFSQAAYLGGDECRRLAAHLRNLADRAGEPKRKGTWTLRVADYVEITTAQAWCEFSPAHARELADALDDAAAKVPAAGPPLEFGRVNYPETLDGVRDLLRDGRTIQAIKRYRQLTGKGLADAKREVEALIEKLFDDEV
ncbi:MAG: hypothetical protein AAGE52_16115 [Myxococcota bacterium]